MLHGILVSIVDGLMDVARVEVVIVKLGSEVLGKIVTNVLVISGSDEYAVDNLTVEVDRLWIMLESPSVNNDPLV